MVDRELDDIVQPADQFMHDWMHCIFVSGVWNICFEMVLQALRSAGIRDVYDSLQDYVKLRCWPRRVNSGKLHELFTDGRRKKNHETLKFIAMEKPPSGGPIDSALFSEVHGLDQSQKIAIRAHRMPHLPCDQLVGFHKKNNVPSC